MTIYSTAYHTTACAGHRMQSVVETIEEAKIRDLLTVADGVCYIERPNGASGQVKAFKHALYIQPATPPKDWHGARLESNEPILAMDIRACCRLDTRSGQFKVVNSTMYTHLSLRAGLSSLWLTQGPAALRAITPMAMAIFASWLSEAIGFKYNLDPKTKYELMILAAILYQSNHIDGLVFDKANEGRYLAGIANALKVPIADVTRLYAQTEAIGSIEDFCDKAKRVLNNVRLESLNHGTLISLMGATWAGDNAVELTAVALEHPPTWVGLVHEANTNMALKKVGLSKIVERKAYRDGLERLGQLIRQALPETVQRIDTIPSFY